MTSAPAPPANPSEPQAARRRAWPWALLAGTALVAGLVAVGEAQGWRFTAGPAQRWLAVRLDRPVQGLDADNGFQLHFWGGIRLEAARLRIDNPGWSTLGPLLDAHNLRLQMNWRDLLGWRPGRSLRLQSLAATRLDLQLQRLPDGRASWQLGPPQPQPTTAAQPLAEVVTVQQVHLATGDVVLNDAMLGLVLAGRFSQPGLASTAGSHDIATPAGLHAEASGSWRGKPVRATLRSGSPGGWLASAQAANAPVPVSLQAQAGRANLRFDGEVQRLLDQPALIGRYHLAGPSLAALGDAIGLTLPQTRAFDMTGRLAQSGARWHTVVDQARIGSSRLAGAFVLERPPGAVPMLSGRLRGPALLLQDLGPAIGGRSDGEPAPARGGKRVLPDRRFDLPSLRAMNANLLIDLDRLDFGTSQLQSAAPLRGHLQLQDGVLLIDQLEATLAQGRLTGALRLDGRQAPALWSVDLGLRGLLLEQWVRAVQRPGQPPYASGRLGGQIQLAGRGNSTAELLGHADGRVQLRWTRGQVSHLLVELAGLDVAEGLGLLITGDQQLSVGCAAADLQIQAGRATPQLMLVDTRDTLLWVDGSLSLADERLQLRAHALPKDWSPLTLRTPLHITGTLGQPQLSLDKPALLGRALPAALLALLHPLAALLPLMDRGDEAQDLLDCRSLGQRYRQLSAGADKP